MHIDDIDERAIAIGEFVAATGSTVRATAKRFGVSKSTVHKDITVRLRPLCPRLFSDVSRVLERNRAERHIRGGIATRMRYKNHL